ncbi:unnamed protein product [Lymnaea stagnalis]|uniref:Uncharacterized protein n=1 Tax=Lymnaea stagnalis TaxID=6523 RepID=A0AAV2I6M3_LYMST
MTYKQHADMAEKIVQSRINYFRKKNLYYSGWSMEEWWDEKLKAVEKLKKELRKMSQDDEEDRRPTFSVTLQERLHAAAKMELSYEEPTPSWPRKILRRTCSLPATVETPSLENDMKTQVIGHLNWTPIIFKQPSMKTPRKPQAPAKCLTTMPYLPVIFHWKEMEMSKGYELSRTDKKHKCGYFQG